MAEATVGGSILSKIQEEAYKSKEAREHHNSLIDQLKQSVPVTEDLKTEFVKAAEEEAAAKIDKAKADETKKKADAEAAAAQKKRDFEAMSHFQQLGNVLKSQSTQMIDGLKDDFKQLTAGVSMISEAPGFKSIITILKAVGVTLSSLLLINLKNSGILGAFGDRLAQSAEGAMDWAQTWKNFKPDWMLDDKDKAGKAKSIKDSADKRTAKETGPPAPKEDGFLKKMNERANGMKDNLVKSFEGAKGKTGEFATSMKTKFSDGVTKMGEKFQGVGDTMGKAGGKLKGMGGKLVTGVKGMGKQFMGLAKNLAGAVARMAVAAGSFIAGLAASAVSMLIAAAPLLLKALIIGAAIAILIFAVYWLYKKFVENKDMIMARWEMIKEGFMTTMDGLILWKDKATAFISNIFKSIWLSIKSLFASVMSGIENGINAVIRGINALIPGTKWDLDPVDIGAGEMRRKVDEEQAAFEVEKAAQSEEFASRQKDIDDRRANNTMERAQSIVTQNNNTVQEGSKQTTVVPSGTTPTDTDASMMALAQ